MSAGLAKIKRRISSIESTKKITNAMELVSSVKLKRRRKAMDNTIEYLKMMSDIISDCFKGLDENGDHLSRLLKPCPTGKGVLYLVITSNMGLCGGYNYNVIKYLNTQIKKGDEIMMIGTKGLVKFKNKDEYLINTEEVDVLDHFDFGKLSRLEKKLSDIYRSGKYTSIKLIYTKYVNSITFKPQTVQILPVVNLVDNNGDKKEENKNEFPPIYAPNRNEVFKLLVPQYLNTLLFEKFEEAMVCEEGSRRNAMENATDNAEDLQSELTLTFNKARQAAITNSIIEIMSGQAAEKE
ncbi:MAG: ATP synthase F1 subunit gamma [Bacilli bacterium]